MTFRGGWGDKRHPQISGVGDAPIMRMQNARPVIPPRPARLSTNQQNDGRLAGCAGDDSPRVVFETCVEKQTPETRRPA